MRCLGVDRVETRLAAPASQLPPRSERPPPLTAERDAPHASGLMGWRHGERLDPRRNRLAQWARRGALARTGGIRDLPRARRPARTGRRDAGRRPTGPSPAPTTRVAGSEWDEVVDISSIPEHVAAAVDALAPRARHWTYISSLSVYARNDEIGADETADLHEPAVPGEEYDYGRAKSAAEASVRAGLGDRAAIVRPGLIVGPGDPTDRFGYWVGRFALAGGEPVLAPTLDGLTAQVIDVDDLAEFIVGRGESGWHGVANATGESIDARCAARARARDGRSHRPRPTRPTTSGSPLTRSRTGQARGRCRCGSRATCRDSRPARSPAYRAAGGRLRDLRETLERTLADERERGLDRERKSGLSRAEELDLLAQL